MISEIGIRYSDIRATLNAGGGAVTGKLSTAFGVAAKINKWSYHKPMAIAKLFGVTDADILAVDNGISNIAAMVKDGHYAAGSVANTQDRLIFALPDGSASQPYRLTDFAGYDPTQGEWFAMEVSSAHTTNSYGESEVDGPSMTIRFANGSWLEKMAYTSTARAALGVNSTAPDANGVCSWGVIVGTLSASGEYSPTYYYNMGSVKSGTTDTGIGSGVLLPMKGNNLLNPLESDTTVWGLIPALCSMSTDLDKRRYQWYFGSKTKSGEGTDGYKFLPLVADGAMLRFRRISAARKLVKNVRFAINVSASGCTDGAASATWNVEVTNNNTDSLLYKIYITINSTDSGSDGVVYDGTSEYATLDAGVMAQLPSSGSYMRHWNTIDGAARVTVNLTISDVQQSGIYAETLIWDSVTSCGGAGHGTIIYENI